jgi:hypothetical protein
VPEVVIEAAHGRVRARWDERGLRIEPRFGSFEAGWDELVGGGLVRGRVPDLERAMPDAPLPPGTVTLARLGRDVHATHRGLMLARSRAGRRPRPFLIWLPSADAGTGALLDAVGGRLGSAWRGGEWDYRALRRELGARDPRRYAVLGLLFAVAIALLVFPAIAGWDALKDGDLGELGPATLIPLAIWLGLVALLVVLVRRR